MANLSLQNINKIYPNGVQAVFDFNLDVNDGEFIVLVGPSGCGKSTTLRMVAGLEEISSGKLLIDEKDVTNMPPKDRDIAMVFQNYALYAHMTVYENMAFSLVLRHEDRNVIHEKVMKAADILGLRDQLNKKPGQLSGGQRQRVAIARALVTKAPVILADEPTANLDSKNSEQILSLMKSLNKDPDLQTTFIFSTHDSRIVDMCDHVVHILDGQVTNDEHKVGSDVYKI
jgi:multiple sugar transport system ATP-binding protein